MPHSKMLYSATSPLNIFSFPEGEDSDCVRYIIMVAILGTHLRFSPNKFSGPYSQVNNHKIRLQGKEICLEIAQ